MIHLGQHQIPMRGKVRLTLSYQSYRLFGSDIVNSDEIYALLYETKGIAR